MFMQNHGKRTNTHSLSVPFLQNVPERREGGMSPHAAKSGTFEETIS